MTRLPCDQCYGTDFAGACAQGHCYVEEQQREREERDRENAEFERQFSVGRRNDPDMGRLKR